MSDVNCPFYGYSLNFMPYPPGYGLVLWPTGANQCALERAATIPCHMEAAGDTPDHNTCQLVKKCQNPPQASWGEFAPETEVLQQTITPDVFTVQPLPKGAGEEQPDDAPKQ